MSEDAALSLSWCVLVNWRLCSFCSDHLQCGNSINTSRDTHNNAISQSSVMVRIATPFCLPQNCDAFVRADSNISVPLTVFTAARTWAVTSFYSTDSQLWRDRVSTCQSEYAENRSIKETQLGFASRVTPLLIFLWSCDDLSYVYAVSVWFSIAFTNRCDSLFVRADKSSWSDHVAGERFVTIVTVTEVNIKRGLGNWTTSENVIWR